MAQVRAVRGDHDVTFVVAGTGLAPRVHLTPAHLTASTWEEVSRILGRVVTRMVWGR